MSRDLVLNICVRMMLRTLVVGREPRLAVWVRVLRLNPTLSGRKTGLRAQRRSLISHEALIGVIVCRARVALQMLGRTNARLCLRVILGR